MKKNKASEHKPRKAVSPKQDSTSSDNSKKYIAVIGAIIIVIIFAGAIVFGLRSQAPPSPQANLSTFEHNFESANAIGVYATYTTNASFPDVIGCSTALVEAIAGKGQMHKSYSQIHYFVINQTACTSAILGPNATTSVGSIGNCTAFSTTHPSIFVNYSTFTKTFIKPDALYFYGNSTSLLECGIASQIS